MTDDAGIEAVRRLCEGWHRMTAAEFSECMTDDVDYRNIPIDGDHHVGPDAAHAVLSRFAQTWGVRLEVLNLVGDGAVVLTERHEHFVHRAGTKQPFMLPVMGAFELRDGKISAWRDYFELSQLRLR